MTPYFKGILTGFGNPVLHGWSNILDNYLSNSIFKRVTTLIFFSQFTNLLFLPIIFLLSPSLSFSIRLLPVLLLIALIEIAYQYPYYWSLRRADTSVVNALFSLGKISVPVFAFFLAHERISSIQYLGFFMIILSSVALTLDIKKLRLNTAFFLMLFVSVILSLQSVLFKYLYLQGVNWGSSIVFTGVAEFALIATLFVFPKNRQALKVSTKKIAEIGPLFILAQFLTWSGEASGFFAVSVIPVSIVSGITSTQPVFIFLYALLFGKKVPLIFKEKINARAIVKKSLCFLLIILGTMLIIIR